MTSLARTTRGPEPTDVELELAELNRRYRIMEGDRKSYAEESQNQIRKQRQTIEKLKQDNDYLKEELQLVQSKAMEYRQTHTTEKLMGLQEQVEVFQERMEDERARMTELDKEAKALDRAILEQRSKLGGTNAALDTSAQVEKQKRVLENRLDKALVKFNEALSVNKGLRENIDTLRRERVVFDGIYRKLEKRLLDKKREMAHIIEVSNSAYESRDEAQMKMIQLKEKADKELASFESELKELSRLIEQDRKMKDFMKLKEKERDSTLRGSGAGGELTKAEEARLKKKKKQGTWDLARDKASLQLSMEKVQSYEEAFAKIQGATGISDIDEFVETFIKVEDQNFSLFNYVNELNNEIERLDEQILETKAEIEKYKGEGASSDNQRKKVLKDLEERLEATKSRAESYELKYNAAIKVVTELKTSIQSVFTAIGASDETLSDILGSGGVTEGNMMQYLGLIEQRTNEILQYVAGKQAKLAAEQAEAGPDDPMPKSALISILAGAPPVVSVPTGPTAPVGANTFSIMPPTTGDDFASEDDSEEEEEERPLSRNELKMKTLRGLAKKDAKTRTGGLGGGAGGRSQGGLDGLSAEE